MRTLNEPEAHGLSSLEVALEVGVLLTDTICITLSSTNCDTTNLIVTWRCMHFTACFIARKTEEGLISSSKSMLAASMVRL
jgi:hypothetical protein